MATTLYMRDDFGDYGFGALVAKLDASNSGWTSALLSTTRGNGVNSFATSTVAGATSGVEVALSGTPWQWISEPIAADVTISGSITWNLWANESSMSANVAINGKLEVIDGATGTITLIDKTARVTELGTSGAAANFSETPASGVACKRGDRLRVTVFGDDAGTMASGFTFTFYYDAASGGVSGDSFLTLTETVTFESAPSGTTVYLTDVASDVATAAVDRVAWTSRDDGNVGDSTNTAGGWLTPIQTTDGAGGTVVDWWTKQLTAFTLGGAVRVNVWAHEANLAAEASIRCEIYITASDGSSPTLWAANTYPTELTTSAAAQSFLVSGDDTSISNGQRLLIRLLIDDNGQTSMVNGYTVTTQYGATSGGATGDSYLTFSQTLTEYTSGTEYTQGLTATLSFAGSTIKLDKKPLPGTLSFVGSQSKLTSHKMTGTLSFIGSALKKTSRSLAGALSFAGSLVGSKLTYLSLTGTLSFSGSLAKRSGKSLAGTLTTAGSLTRFISRPLAGTLTTSGVLAKRTSRPLAGTLAFSGSLAKRAGKALTGVLGFTGTVSKRGAKALSGTLTSSGALAKRTSRGLAGTLSFSGSTLKRTTRPLTGTLSFSGSLVKQTGKALAGALSFVGGLASELFHSGGNLYEQALTGTLSFSGGLVRDTRKSLAATLSPSGTLSKWIFRSLPASLSFAGGFAKMTGKPLAGTLSFVGAFSKRTGKLLTGTLSFAGSLARFTTRALTGTLSFVGDLPKQTSRALTATLSFVGGFNAKSIFTIAFTAALSFSGSVGKQAGKSLTGTLSFVGNQSKAVAHVLQGTLTFAGDTAKATSRSLAGGLSFVGSLAPSRLFYKALTATLSFVGGVGRSYIPSPFITFGGDALTRMKTGVSRFPWYARGNRRGRR